jgi:hypothetical protein
MSLLHGFAALLDLSGLLFACSGTGHLDFWRVSVKHDLGVLEALFLDQCKQGAGVLGRKPYTAMGSGLAKVFCFVSAMDGVPFLCEENRMRHRRIVPLFAVPNLVH